MELIFTNDYIYTYVGNTKYGPFPRNPGGGTYGDCVGISSNSMQFNICDIECYPMPLTERLADRSNLEVVKVKSRKFLCEQVTEPSDWYFSRWALYGDTNPTNKGTEYEPIFDFYEDTNANNKKSAMYLLSGVSKVKNFENHIITCKVARMKDDTSLDPSCIQASLLRDGTGFGEFLQQRGSGAAASYAYIVYQPGTTRYVSYNANWPNDGNYYDLTAARYNGKVYWIIPATEQEIESEGTTAWPGGYREQIPLISCQHDAGQVTHVRIKDWKVYKILAEMRP